MESLEGNVKVAVIGLSGIGLLYSVNLYEGKDKESSEYSYHCLFEQNESLLEWAKCVKITHAEIKNSLKQKGYGAVDNLISDLEAADIIVS